MKHSNHSPSPPSPVSRKLRSDSKLAALAPGAQSLLLQKLETLSYQETASWLQDTHGICASPSNLSTFRSRHLESEALKQAYLQAAVFNSTLQDLPEIDPGDEQVEAAVRRLFLFKIVGQGDIGAYLQFTRLGNESKKLALTQARQERLQRERQQAHDEDPEHYDAVIGRRLDLIQAGKFPQASASPSAAAPPAPVAPPPSAASTPSPESPADWPLLSPAAASPGSEAEPSSSASSLAPPSPSSPSNSLKYPKIPSIRNTAFFLPDPPAPCPTRAGETKPSLLSFPGNHLRAVGKEAQPKGRANAGSEPSR